MNRLEHLRNLHARIQTEIDREEAYLRRMASVRTDYRAHVSRADWTTRVIVTTAKHYEIPPEDIVGPGRKAKATEARHVACWLLRDAGRTYPEIGRRIKRDHTTAINAVRRVDTNPELMEVAIQVRSLLLGDESEDVAS